MTPTPSKPTVPDEAILAAVMWCRVGAGAYNGKRWHHPIGMFGQEVGNNCFHEAERIGLLAHDPVWRATPSGESLLLDKGVIGCLTCYDTGYRRDNPRQRGVSCPRGCGKANLS